MARYALFRRVGMCAAFMILFGWASSVWAQPGIQRGGGIRLGPLRVHPGVTVSGTYTDNYFLEPEDEEWEWTTTVSPTLTLLLPLRRHSVEFIYRSDFMFNKNNSEYDEDRHDLAGRINLDFPGGLTITAGHEWIASSNPPVVQGDDRKRFKDNVSTVEVGYAFSNRYSVVAAYKHSFRRFNSDRYDFDDSNVDDVSLDLKYRIMPKTTVFVEGGWQRNHYPERGAQDTDNTQYRAWAGVETAATAKIVGVLKGGWTKKIWDEDVAGDDVSTFGVEGDLYYDLTPRTRLALQVYRRVQDTELTTTDNVVYGSSYTLTGGSFSVKQVFHRRLSADGRLGVSHRQFNEEGLAGEKRSDWLVQAGVGLDYQLWKWVTVGASYDFTDNNSDIDTEDYTENRAMVYLTLGL